MIRSPEDLFRRTGVPVTSVLSTRLHDGEVTVLQPLSADGRGYARLRNLVSTSLDESNRKVVLVAGVRRGGGPIAANLAASLARAGEEVVPRLRRRVRRHRRGAAARRTDLRPGRGPRR